MWHERHRSESFGFTSAFGVVEILGAKVFVLFSYMKVQALRLLVEISTLQVVFGQ